MLAMAHGRPRPRKTFTELDPVILPMAESANSDDLAAVILAKVSGKEVPKATSVIAVTASLIPSTQPKTLAISPTTAVTSPIKTREIIKAGLPPHILIGGTMANKTFQKIVIK